MVAITKKPDFYLHEQQQQFVECKALYRGYVAGRSSGKTTCGAYDLIVRSKPGRLYMIVAPTFRMLEDGAFRAFKKVAKKLGQWNEKKYFKSDNRCILNNGAEILFRSADTPDALRGSSVSGAWLDECSKMKEVVFEIVMACLREDGEQGWMSSTFTPNGPEHWTARVFGNHENSNVTLFKCSTKDNPFNPPGFYETLLKQYGTGPGGLLRARQELEGDIVCVSGAEWGGEYFLKDVWFTDWPRCKEEDCIKVAALDASEGIGKDGDYSSFCKLMFYNGIWYCEFDMDNMRNTTEITRTALDINYNFRPYQFGIEEAFGGKVLLQEIVSMATARDAYIPVVTVGTGNIKKEQRILSIGPLITNNVIRFKKNESTQIGVQQIQSFPHGEHDDAPDSLEMAYRMAMNYGVAGYE